MKELQDESEWIIFEDELYKEQYGFSSIVDLLIESKIPIIGHNMMYDICYFYRQFIGDLPKTWPEFREEWHKYFPLTYDTKVMS